MEQNKETLLEGTIDLSMPQAEDNRYPSENEDPYDEIIKALPEPMRLLADITKRALHDSIKENLGVSVLPSIALEDELSNMKYGDMSLETYKTKCPQMQQIGHEFAKSKFRTDLQHQEEGMYAALDKLQGSTDEKFRLVLAHFIDRAQSAKSNTSIDVLQRARFFEIGLALACVALNTMLERYEKEEKTGS